MARGFVKHKAETQEKAEEENFSLEIFKRNRYDGNLIFVETMLKRFINMYNTQTTLK